VNADIRIVIEKYVAMIPKNVPTITCAQLCALVFTLAHIRIGVSKRVGVKKPFDMIAKIVNGVQNPIICILTFHFKVMVNAKKAIINEVSENIA